jgi:lauroyl/myristoyl acyltransferase
MGAMTVATLADRLAEVEAPTAHRLEVRGEPLQTLLRGTGLHRAVPTPVAVAAIRAAARTAWRSSAPTRDRARSWARAVLGPAATAEEVDGLARRHLVESMVGSELQWRTWLGHRMPVDGMDHLRAAKAHGRGAIVACTHVGPMMLMAQALCAHGERPYFARKGGDHAGVVHGANGRWIKTMRGAAEDAGCRFVSRGKSADVLTALLDRGATILTPWDVPGRGRITLLGRPARISAGVARLAASTGAPVVPALTWHEKGRARARLKAPIGGDAEAILRALAADYDAVLHQHLPQAHDVLAQTLGAHDATGAAT